MSHDLIAHKILSFAQLLEVEADHEAAVQVAQDRRWIDETGAPTDDGHALVRAFTEQQFTRTTLRNV